MSAEDLTDRIESRGICPSGRYRGIWGFSFGGFEGWRERILGLRFLVDHYTADYSHQYFEFPGHTEVGHSCDFAQSVDRNYSPDGWWSIHLD